MPPAWLTSLEQVARSAHRFTNRDTSQEIEDAEAHPFDLRDIHSALPDDVRNLFDNGHFAQATFEALKFLDKEVQRLSGLSSTGKDLMMQAFKESSPLLKISETSDLSGQNMQEGYKFIFAGSMIAVRNPRGHEHSVQDDLNTCLEHLTIVSHLMRVLENGGYDVGAV